MLSATISGAVEMVNWIGNLKKIKCHLVSTNKRPVPLKHTIYWDDKLHTYLDNDTNWYHNTWTLVKKDMDKYFSKNRFSNVFFHKCLDYLKNNNLVPVTVFLLNREAVENQAKVLPNFVEDHIEHSEIKKIWNKYLLKYRHIYEHTQQWSMLFDLVSKGIGIHHSGMIPVLKEIVEILYDKGLIKVLLATETFAMGVNMPTKTVIFTNVTKFDGNHKRLFRPEEYGQMAGRAGRRGKDKEGLIVTLPFFDFITETEAKSFMLAPPQKINSKLSIDYSLILKLLNYKIDSENNDEPIEFLTNKLTNTLFNGQGSKEVAPLIREQAEYNEKLKNLLPFLNDGIKNKRVSFNKLNKIIDDLNPKGYFKLDKKLEKKLLNEKKNLEEEFNSNELKLLDSWVSLENKINNVNYEIDYTINKITY